MPLGIGLTRKARLGSRPERTGSRAAGEAILRPSLLRAATSALAGAAALVGAARPVAAEPSTLTPQLAYSYGENETPRAAAFGGALRALGNGTSGVFTNPSAIAETRVYHLQALAQMSPDAGRWIFGGAIVDSVTSRLAAGVSVVGGGADAGGADRSLIDARIAIAYPITERLFIGLGGRYARITQNGTLAEGGLGKDDKVSGGLVGSDGKNRDPLVNDVTFDAAVTVKAADAVFISVVGQNLSYPDNGLLPTTLGGGVGVGTDDFSVELDGLADFNSYTDTTARIMAGGEYLVADHFPIRLGYRFDQGAAQHALSLGAGYVGTEFSVEAAVRRGLSTDGPTTIFIGLAYHLESSGLTRATTESF
jgi:opacity protein-like surface antigen